MSTNDGGPAFPRVCPEDSEHTAWDTPGMTLRDYFAAKVMQAFLSTPEMLCGAMKGIESRDAAGVIAQAAYEQADAMLAERGKPK